MLASVLPQHLLGVMSFIPPLFPQQFLARFVTELQHLIPTEISVGSLEPGSPSKIPGHCLIDGKGIKVKQRWEYLAGFPCGSIHKRTWSQQQ